MKYAHKHKIREDFPPHAKVVEKICKYCGTPFWTNRHWAEFGTPTCRVYYWRVKQDGMVWDKKGISEKIGSNHNLTNSIKTKGGEKFEVRPYARKKIYRLLAEAHDTWDKQVIGGKYREWIQKAEDREFTLAEIFRRIQDQERED